MVVGLGLLWDVGICGSLMPSPRRAPLSQACSLGCSSRKKVPASAYEWPTRPVFIAGQCLNDERLGTVDLIGGVEPCPTGSRHREASLPSWSGTSRPRSRLTTASLWKAPVSFSHCRE